MRASKTEAAVNYEDMICLHEVLQLLRELECLGFVNGQGNSSMGTLYMLLPIRHSTEVRSVTIWGGASGTNDCQGKDTQWIP
jgi:hypothetical protein